VRREAAGVVKDEVDGPLESAVRRREARLAHVREGAAQPVCNTAGEGRA